MWARFSSSDQYPLCFGVFIADIYDDFFMDWNGLNIGELFDGVIIFARDGAMEFNYRQELGQCMSVMFGMYDGWLIVQDSLAERLRR